LKFNPNGNLKGNENLPNVKRFLATFKERDYSLLLNYWQNAVAKDPQNPTAHLRIAEIYYKQGKLEAADQELADLDLNNGYIPNHWLQSIFPW
jgi:Tfp pilus assembly protein PilF